jgi:hypothetical protein
MCQAKPSCATCAFVRFALLLWLLDASVNCTPGDGHQALAPMNLSTLAIIPATAETECLAAARKTGAKGRRPARR